MEQKFLAYIKQIRERAWEVETLSKVLYVLNLYEMSEIDHGDFITITEILLHKSVFLTKMCSKKLRELETSVFTHCKNN